MACNLPPADEQLLHEDRILYGTSYKYRCKTCGKWHRVDPRDVAVERLKPVTFRIEGMGLWPAEGIDPGSAADEVAEKFCEHGRRVDVGCKWCEAEKP